MNEEKKKKKTQFEWRIEQDEKKNPKLNELISQQYGRT